MAAWRTLWISAALGLTTAAPAGAQVVDLFGVQEATLEWTPATGAVSGYYVIVSRNGGAPSLHGVSNDTRETVASPIGEVITVQVAAFDAAGVAGPVSAPSQPLRFNPAPTPPPSTPPPTTTPTEPELPDDPAPEDPTETPGESPRVGSAPFDFSGDGRSDMLLRHRTTGALTLWTLDENQVAAQKALPHLPYPWRLEAFGDYDGDGGSDLLWRDETNGKLTLWLMRDGQMSGGGALTKTGLWLSRSWKVNGSADFDGDGRADIVMTVPSQGKVEILLMDGATVLSRISRQALTPDWRVVATPDSDGDGVPELLWEHQKSRALALEWIATPGKTSPLGTPGWLLLGSADIDGDGSHDLWMRETQSGRVQPWLLDAARVTPVNSWSMQPGDSSWEFRGVGDFDGDGRGDPFWHHPQDGAVELWFAGDAGVEPAFVSAASAGKQIVGDGGD